MIAEPALMITCEHASNALPDFVLRTIRDCNMTEALRRNEEYSDIYGIPDEVLASHRGYDIGAFKLFSNLVKRLKPDFNCSAQFSRLVVDMNRSPQNRTFFSEYTTHLPKNTKERIIALWTKYRSKIEKFVSNKIPENLRCDIQETPLKVIHLGIHSFTPILNGTKRDADVGILYDPSRLAETQLADIIIKNIHERAPWLRIRKNYPYLGKSDGLTTTLRKKFGAAYAGLEIEINQKLFD